MRGSVLLRVFNAPLPFWFPTLHSLVLTSHFILLFFFVSVLTKTNAGRKRYLRSDLLDTLHRSLPLYDVEKEKSKNKKGTDDARRYFVCDFAERSMR